MENLKLDLENQPAAKADAKPKVPKIHVVVDQEWVSLIANLLKQHQPELTNILCLGAYTDPEALHKAYTSSLILNPLFCTKEAAKKCDQTSRLWIANIQAVGDSVKTLRQLLDNALAPHNNYGPHLLTVITDNPKEALNLQTFPYEFLIISPVPVPGFRGNMKVRCHNRDYQYFFNCHGSFNFEYTPDSTLSGSNHHIFSTRDHLERIYVNFNISALGKELLNKLNSGGRCEVIPVQYLDTTFKIGDHGKVKISTSGAVQLSDLMSFGLQLIPEAVTYNPVEMKETSLFDAATNPLFPAAVGYAETVKFFETLGLEFPDNRKSKAAMEHAAESYRHQTIPMIKPTGDQLLAYYKPGYYKAKKDFFITISGKKIPSFVKGKEYYLYPVQHSEVIELPESQLLDPTSKELTSKTMSLHCTYTALSISSELKPKEIKDYNTEHGTGFKVVTAEEYELARKIQTADAMGNTNNANELRDRLKAQRSRRLNVTSKDPNLAGVLEVFPPPEVQTLSEAYPDKLKARVGRLQTMGAKVTPIQTLHAALASLKRGVVFTHNVGSGKTRIAAYAAIAAGAKRIAFIAKSKILGEIVRELRDELGMRVTHIHSAACIRRIEAEILAENLAYKKALAAAGDKPVPPLEPQFYLISQEFLTIGGLANQTFDPYIIDVTEEVPAGGGNAACEKIHTLTCTRENAEKEVKAQILKMRADGVITGKVNRIPMRFHQHVQECPKCMEAAAQKLFNIQKRKRWIDLTPATRKAIREQIVDYVKRGKIEAGMNEFGTFSKHGHCRVCGYLARSYRRMQDIDSEVTEDLADLLEALGEEEKSTEKGQKFERGFRSALQFPAYRLLKNLFDTKICDEAHSLTGNSLVYDAVSSIHTERTFLLSGTLLRRTPAEMWQVFTLLWGFRSPEFPYGYEHQTEFIDQHVTYRITRETVAKGAGTTAKKATKSKTEEMPEPANAPKLWRFLHQAQLHATNRSMGLRIPEVKRHFLEIPLDGQSLEDYNAKLIELKTSYVNRPAVFSLQTRADWFTRVNELQTVALGAKLGKLMPVMREYIGSGRSIIVACKQQKTYARLVEIFTEEGLDFVKLDEKKPSQPHMRREWLDENFVKSSKNILLTRTPLINESLNNLVKASVIIVVEAEYVFYPLQQLEGRIARPRQKMDKVDVVYMVTRHPTKTSVDEAMLQMALRRNNANVELVSGNVTQRTNEQLVEMAETQKMREMELLQTLVAGAQAEKVDYNGEFTAREQEIESAERSKAIIVVNDELKQHLVAARPEKEAVSAISEAPLPKSKAEPAPAQPVPALMEVAVAVAPVQYKVEGDHLLLPIEVPRVESKPKLRNKLKALKAAVAELRGETLTLFPTEEASQTSKQSKV